MTTMQNTVFLCVGTTKIIGDCVGPWAGDILRNRGVGAYVYGTPERPVTSLNIGEYVRMLEKNHKDDLVIVIDATLGATRDVGKIKLNPNGIKPGGAFHSERGRIGDIGIMAIVGEASGDRLLELKTRDRNFVRAMAQKAANVALSALF